jgi:anhydro-N-acetylmuramic acid kinase
MGKTKYSVIGVMSGTSLDGLDIAYCIFEKKDEKWDFKIKYAETAEYPEYWINKLKSAPRLSGYELSLLNNEYGYYIGEQVRDFILKNKVEVDFISSHGHTVFHQPQKRMTLQIGSGACISAVTGLDVINDFRIMDVASGGQGAPLVPIGDKLLFSSYNYCINLGGIANISFDINDKRIAFDICPVNMAINFFADKIGLKYDKDGKSASEGKINFELLDNLNSIDYYHQSYPKSLGKEFFESKFLPVVQKYNIDIKDILRTITEHIAIQISEVIDLKGNNKLLFTGGGSHNKFLMQRISEKLNIEIEKQDDLIIDFKEALIFAFLGVLFTRNETNCLSTVTGANKDTIGGVLHKNY